MRKLVRKRFLVIVVLVAFFTASCGYMLYPERRNQGNTGEIDPAVLIMDCAWLFVFVVPGLVALIVDFTTGGMYIEGTSLNIEPGRKIAVRLRGQAPADACFKVVIMDGNSGNIIATLLERDFKAGEEMEDVPIVSVPENLAEGDYSLNVLVNGAKNSTWDFHISQ